MKKIKEAFLTGELGCCLAEFWFKYVGYLAAISALSLASEKIENTYLSGASAFSYFVIFLWVKARSDHFIWWIIPSWKPVLGERSPFFSKRTAGTIFGGCISGYITMGTYILAEGIVQELVSKAA
ncbi:hypothetical protein [Teredinibacter turnerae]|uniref:hypothetical protein n=1 Tax=Teredinibacter turnerae TaxID=2426 RepID=UPI0005F87EAE|nr:hypothetical protein [Teredinibacter turnerae]